MNSDEVLDTLDKIGLISSNKEREIAVRLAMGDKLFRKVALLACDSFVTFGMTGQGVGFGTGSFLVGDPNPFDGLERMAKRTLTGMAAQMVHESWRETFSSKSMELLNRILNKDLRCKVTSTILNKVEPGFIHVFEVMLAHKFEEKRFIPLGMAAEPKKDGVRVTAIVVNGVATFYSRTGKPFPALDHLRKPLVEFCQEGKEYAALKNHELADYLGDCTQGHACIVLDGEMVSGSFNKTVGDVRRKSVEATDAVFEVFDMLPYRKFVESETINVPMRTRRRMLEALFAHGAPSKSFSILEHKVIETPADAYAAYNDYRARGFEGAMIKDLDAPYKKSRSHAWLKMKACDSVDLLVEGMFEGKGKYVGSLGGLICDFNGVTVNVGGGFSDQQRHDIWTAPSEEISGRMIEVEYHEVTLDGSLRHPRFVRFRDDKHEALAA